MRAFIEEYGFAILAVIIVSVLIVFATPLGEKIYKILMESSETGEKYVKTSISKDNIYLTLSQIEFNGEFLATVKTPSAQDEINIQYRVQKKNGEWTDYKDVDGILSIGNVVHTGTFMPEVSSNEKVQFRISYGTDQKYYESNTATFWGNDTKQQTSLVAGETSYELKAGIYSIKSDASGVSPNITESVNYIASNGNGVIKEYSKINVSNTEVKYNNRTIFYFGTKKFESEDEKDHLIVFTKTKQVSKEFYEWFRNNTYTTTYHLLTLMSPETGEEPIYKILLKGEEYGELPNLEKEHFIFNYWWTESVGGIEMGSTNLMGDYNTTLYSHWISTIKNLSMCDVNLEEVFFTYDGQPKTPKVEVILDLKTLTENVDYKVEYSNNIEPGLGEVLITGIGDYEGTTSRKFKISE